MGKRFMAILHVSLGSTCKSRISKISTRSQIWGEGSIPQILILNWEMNSKFFSNPGEGPFHNFWSWTQKWIQIFFQSWRRSIPQLLILNSEMNSNFFPILEKVHSTTCDPELRNERFTLISFVGFPAILSSLQPFQICICNRKNRKLTFSNGPQLMGKQLVANLHASLDGTCKSRISKMSTRCQIWGEGSIPQLLILNWEMTDLHWYLLWGFLQY